MMSRAHCCNHRHESQCMHMLVCSAPLISNEVCCSEECTQPGHVLAVLSGAAWRVLLDQHQHLMHQRYSTGSCSSAGTAAAALCYCHAEVVLRE
jgi:hypothetical protein